MKVIYRACSVGSEKERPIMDKYALVKTCYASFKEAFKNTTFDLVVLLDKPTAQFRDIFEGGEIEESFYATFDEGNTKSFHRQLDLALESGDNFLLVEDDYLWRPMAGEIVAQTLSDARSEVFITPYDHPDYYRDERHSYQRDIRLMGDHHWGSVSATTLTFGGTHEALKKEIDVMKNYGWADYPMWCDITQRTPLFAPIPSLATHMETPHLAPTIEWLENL